MISLFCATRSVVSIEDAPSVSREENRECLLFNFFDWDDLWHFFSSIGLFYGCLNLLVLDDDLNDVPTTEISVF